MCNTIRESVNMNLNTRLFFDGGTGTLLQKHGISGDPVAANISHPHAITDVHRAYLQAGANVITANTFGAYRHKHDNFAEIIAAAMANARAAVGDTAVPFNSNLRTAQTTPLKRSSLSACSQVELNRNAYGAYIVLDMGPTGLMLEPYGDTTAEELADIFSQTIKQGAAQGADAILIETMMDLNELEIAAAEAKKTGLPVLATMSFDPSGRTMYGASIADLAGLARRLQLDAVGINCGQGLAGYKTLAAELVSLAGRPVIVQPNAGLPEVVNGEARYNLSPAEFAEFMADIAGMGVQILGGCCGTTPAHIAAVVQRV